jgi:hypothetical protein
MHPSRDSTPSYKLPSASANILVDIESTKIAAIRKTAQDPSRIFENTVINFIDNNPDTPLSEAHSLASSYFHRTYGTAPR